MLTVAVKGKFVINHNFFFHREGVVSHVCVPYGVMKMCGELEKTRISRCGKVLELLTTMLGVP